MIICTFAVRSNDGLTSGKKTGATRAESSSGTAISYCFIWMFGIFCLPLHPMKPFVHFLSVAVLCVACLLSGCGDNPRATALLSRADSLMASRPDSALLLLDSLLTDSDRLSTHFVMQCRLRRLNASNKLDTVFTAAHVTQAKALADHFDDCGTPNEQMLAYYLLGRTYADAGEAPRAIEAYNTAADRADTIATDCDYRQLCFVYTQMTGLKPPNDRFGATKFHHRKPQ